MAISKYTHYSMSLIIYTIFKIKATVYSLLKIAIVFNVIAQMIRTISMEIKEIP